MKTILIIEDNPDIRESTAEILELAGYRVLQADNGKLGVEMALQQKVELILCDIMMPELDGYGVLHMLSKNEKTSDVPFIFLTAKAERLDFRKGMEMGADDYLTKPFDDIELLAAIESRLLKKERQEAHFSRALNHLEALAGSGNESGAKELQALIAARKVRHIRKKQILYYNGDEPMGLYLLLSGTIKTLKLAEDGRQLMTGLYKPDDYIGMNAVLLEEPFTDTAEAVEDASLCLLPREAILNLVNKYPDISRAFLKILSNDVREKEEQLIELAYHSVRKRLASVLIRLQQKSSLPGQFKISRDELAAMAGMATETVSRTLSDFKEEGLLEKKGSYIEIIDAERLVRMKN